jgi:3-oxoacyl-[acyl-carrier-protein] synthase II
MAESTRVVVTGMGVMSPVGLDVETMWGNLLAGKSGIGPISLYDTTGFNVHIAGEVHGFDPEQYMPAREARRMDRFTQFAMAALEEVLNQSQLKVQSEHAFEIGAILGSAIGGVWSQAQAIDDLRVKGPRRLNPFHATAPPTDAAPVHIALRTGARGPNLGLSTACASGADAIGQAFETIRRGYARAMFAGGFEAAVAPWTMAVFDATGALSHRNDAPTEASRPFDADRDGFVGAEGGALLVLEDLQFALARGAQPLAEVCSYATTSDAVHLTAPNPAGTGSAQCMRLAIQRAGLEPRDLSYINAHATGTRLGDPAETRALRQVLGEYAERVPVSSTKSMTGHLMGGAGALEAVICIQALRTGYLPPTVNLEHPDPECDLDFVPLRARQAAVEVVLSNSFGFGGHNTALIFRTFR